MNFKTFVQHTHCLQATVHRDNLMVNYKFEDILFLLCGTKRFLVDGIWWKNKSAYYQVTDFSNVSIWFPMFPLSRTMYQATAFWPTTKHSLSSINVYPKLIKEYHVMRKMSHAIKMIANQLCWSTAIMTSMTKKVFQNSN